jgi:mannose-6-phosphate isomerase-like protein (cupin superfamily)
MPDGPVGGRFQKHCGAPRFRDVRPNSCLMGGAGGAERVPCTTMNIRHLPSLSTFTADKMKKNNVFETERFFCDVYCLLPGQSQKTHAHASEDKVYVVLEGSVTVIVGDEAQSLGSGMAVLAAAGQPHGLQNDSGANARVLAFMAPAPQHK